MGRRGGGAGTRFCLDSQGHPKAPGRQFKFRVQTSGDHYSRERAARGKGTWAPFLPDTCPAALTTPPDLHGAAPLRFLRSQVTSEDALVCILDSSLTSRLAAWHPPPLCLGCCQLQSSTSGGRGGTRNLGGWRGVAGRGPSAPAHTARPPPRARCQGVHREFTNLLCHGAQQGAINLALHLRSCHFPEESCPSFLSGPLDEDFF